MPRAQPVLPLRLWSVRDVEAVEPEKGTSEVPLLLFLSLPHGEKFGVSLEETSREGKGRTGSKVLVSKDV